MIAVKGFNEKANRDKTLKYLAVKLAPTIFGVKPSVLLTLKDSKREIANDLFTFYMQNKKYIRRTLNVEIYELKNCGYCAKVMFFRKNLLKEAVCDKWRKRYLARFGYAECEKLEEFLDVLKKRFNSDSFPHEIGIFLGYPLKDVAGFVQCPEKCRKVGRTPWKVFGNPEPSLKMIESHKGARNSMKLVFKGKNDLRMACLCPEKLAIS
jgi:uncharacterized protein DUF3793